MRVNELVAAPPPRCPRRCCHCTHAGARRGGGRRRRARYVYDTKGERGTMTITVLVDWRAMNNLGTMCAAAADTRAACRAGQWAGKSREERREKEREEGRDSRLLQAKLQILGDVSGGEMRVDMDGRRQGEEEGPLSFSRTRLFACRHRCVCVLFRGPGERETEGEGRAQERQAAGGQRTGRAPRRTCLESLVPR